MLSLFGLSLVRTSTLEGQRGRLDVAIAALKTAHGALAGS